MKKFISLFSFALLAMTLSFTACSDDDDVNAPSTPEEIEAVKTSPQAMSLLSLLSGVSDLNELPDNWADASFTVEPTVGHVLDEAQPHVRSLAVANLKEAIEVYNNLTGQKLDAATTANTWNLEGSGSVSYKAVSQSDLFATIDFSIRQLPHLSQLRLVPAAALGTNATFSGEPYYHLGDVVLDVKEGSYWICARPAYSPAGKGDSHWFSFQLTNENYKTFKATKKRKETTVPTDLDKDTRMMNYLMNLLYVMANPNNCADLFQKGRVLEDGMCDFGSGAYSVSMLQQIAQNWHSANVWRHIPVNPDFFQQQNVNVLYYGYSSGLSSTVKLFCKRYSGEAYATANQADYSWDMNTNQEFDAHVFAKDGGVSKSYKVGPDRAIIVRYKKQTDLMKGYKDPTKAMDPTQKKIQDVYRYAREAKRVFVPGDVVKDKHTGALYFCVFPANKEYLKTTKALFVSLDPLAIQFSADKKSATNLIGEDDAMKFLAAIQSLRKEDGLNQKRNLKVFSHVLQHAGLDLKKLYVSRDSTYMIGGTTPSHSTSYCTSILCRRNSDNQMQLLRYIFDMTRAGSKRGEDKEDNLWHELFMKHYLAGNKALMNWTDVMSQDKVNAYAQDIWTKAKFHNAPTATPWRTTAEPATTTLLDYTWSVTSKDFTRPSARSMFNEPMLLMTSVYIDQEQPLPDNFEVVAYNESDDTNVKWRAADLKALVATIAFDLKNQSFMDGVKFVPEWLQNTEF